MIDTKLHAQYCKITNERILVNFEDLIKNQKIEVLPRIPLIPDITDASKNLKKLATYLKKLEIKRIWFLPYNPLWLSKPEKIGIKPLYNHSEWISNKKKTQIKSFFSNFEYNDF